MLIISTMRDKTVRAAHRIGGSVMLSLTGYVKNKKFYKIEGDEKKVTITLIEI